MEVSIALEAAPKALVYASVMLCVGTAAARGLLQLRVAPLLTPEQGSLLEDAFRRLAVASSSILVGALALRAWAHTAAAFGIPEAFSYQNLHIIAVESQWGTGWQLQMAAALALAAVSLSISRWPAGGWLGMSGGAAALSYLLPLLGHAAGDPGRILLHGSHVLAAGIWVGTLTAVSIASRDPRPAHLASPFLMPPRRRTMLSHFSPVGFAGATLLLLTGAIAAWVYLRELSDLWRSTYGRLLLLKLFLAAGVAACGFLNWRLLRGGPVVSPESPRTRRLLVGLEIGLAASVVIVTALLTETEHP